MQIDEACVDSQAPNAAANKNARGVVLEKKLVGLFRSTDGTLLFGDCKGSGQDNYRPSADFSDPAKPVYRWTCPSRVDGSGHHLMTELRKTGLRIARPNVLAARFAMLPTATMVTITTPGFPGSSPDRQRN